MSPVNFNVCSITFVINLLNGVPLSIFVLICDYCTPLSFGGFQMPQLRCPFLLNLFEITERSASNWKIFW